MVYGNKVIWAGAVLASFVLGGCGGASGTGITNSPFAGNYSGTWSNTTSGANGPATITVTTSGVFTGTFHDNVTSTDESVDAVIDNLGNVSGSIVVPGPTVLTLTGPLGFVSPNLTGTLTETSSGTTVGSLPVSLTKQ